MLHLRKGLWEEERKYQSEEIHQNVKQASRKILKRSEKNPIKKQVPVLYVYKLEVTTF